MTPERFAPMAPDRAAYLLAQVEAFEPDWLFSLPYVGDRARPAWLAILAFGTEVLGAPGRVSNGMLGRIRLEWWREALAEVFGNAAVRQHPVVEALSQHVASQERLRPGLEAVIDGMEPFLQHGADTSVEEALAARQSYSALAVVLDAMVGSHTDGQGFALHSLCRVAPSSQLVPAEDGTELPSHRFSRFLAQAEGSEAALAQALRSYRGIRDQEFSPASLPLCLFRTKGGKIVRLRNPFRQRISLFSAVLRGRV